MVSSKILLVEDNPDEEELALFAFQKCGIARENIVVVGDGQEAVDFLCGEANANSAPGSMIRVVFLDLNLPKLSGLEVLKRLRQHENTALLPVVILTSSDEQKDIIQGYQSGANSYVRKSFDLKKFTADIKALGEYWLGLNLTYQE